MARPRDQPLRQLLDQMRPAKRIDHMRHIGFALQMKLRIARDAGGVVGRQPQRLIQRIRMQRLRMTGNCRTGLDTGARPIV